MGYILQALEKGYSEHHRFACCTDNMFDIFVHFGRCMCYLPPPFVNRQPPCFPTTSHPMLLHPQMHHRNPWFGNRHAPAGQAGYALLIAHPLAMQKGIVQPGRSNLHAPTRSTKLCVDLTNNSLWAMPLNTGWVPVKACRLQDWGKLKKYVPVHKQGDVCPNGVPALVERDNNDDY